MPSISYPFLPSSFISLFLVVAPSCEPFPALSFFFAEDTPWRASWGPHETLLGAPWGGPGSLLGAFWGPLGASLGHFAANHGLPRRLGHDLECLGGVLGPSWAVMGLSLGHLGALLGRLRALLDCLGALFGHFWTIFGASQAVSDARKTEESIIHKSYKNNTKIVVFLFRGPLGGGLRAVFGRVGSRLGPSRGCLATFLTALGPLVRPGSPGEPSARASTGRPGPSEKASERLGEAEIRLGGGAPSGVPGPVKIYE